MQGVSVIYNGFGAHGLATPIWSAKRPTGPQRARRPGDPGAYGSQLFAWSATPKVSKTAPSRRADAVVQRVNGNVGYAMYSRRAPTRPRSSP
jgi:hypothetical protein